MPRARSGRAWHNRWEDRPWPVPDHYQHRDARALLPALRAARTAAKISQLEMCAILGVADGVVSHWEGGSRKPSLEMLCLYAEGLGLKITVVPRDQHPDAPPPLSPDHCA